LRRKRRIRSPEESHVKGEGRQLFRDLDKEATEETAETIERV
jgi:hypothetical protein